MNRLRLNCTAAEGVPILETDVQREYVKRSAAWFALASHIAIEALESTNAEELVRLTVNTFREEHKILRRTYWATQGFLYLL